MDERNERGEHNGCTSALSQKRSIAENFPIAGEKAV
jgi:hypothetical protein